MSLGHLFRYARTLAPGAAAAHGWRLGRRLLGAYGRQAGAYFRSTYEPAKDGQPRALGGYAPEMAAAVLAPQWEPIAAVTGQYLDHRFDLLGSGWVRVEHGMRCRGFEGHRYPPVAPSASAEDGGAPSASAVSPGNRARARAIRRLTDPDYRPIDWQIDFKSGYRWSARRWYRTIRFGHEPGVDVKAPWELARLQHLVQLAWAYIGARAKEAGFEAPETYASEFRNQVLDFLAANPPRFGVNWYSTMEVAIRAANLLLALDLFRRHGARFDAAFMGEFTAAVEAHGRHIVNNPEGSEAHRANHYLAGIAGLLFVAAYLPRTPETDRWLAFAVRQLIAEVERQFTPDGANFEASTGYHRLSAEMAIYATALVLGLPRDKTAALAEYDSRPWRHHPALPPAPVEMHPLPGTGDAPGAEAPRSPFPPWYFERLERMAEFSMHVTKPDGRPVQIGDTDSGRFFKLCPLYRRMTAGEARRTLANLAGYDDLSDDQPYWDEEPLDHRGVVGAINGLFARSDFAAFAGRRGAVETAVAAGLAGGRTIASYLGEGEPPGAGESRVSRAGGAPADNGPAETVPAREIVVELPDPSVLDGLTAVAYLDFGLFIWRSPRLFLSVRCGPIGQNGNGGHAHHDQLAVELNVDGVDWLADPGSYVYTPSPRRREAYRSVHAHAAPRAGSGEPARRELGLFRLDDTAKAGCLRFDATGFHGIHSGFGGPVYRTVAVNRGRIVIGDGPGSGPGTGAAGPDRTVVGTPEALRALFPASVQFSPGYGKIVAADARP